MFSMVKRIFGIVACGGIGAVAGWWLTQALELSGVAAALVATVVAVVIAAGMWSGVVATFDRMHR